MHKVGLVRILLAQVLVPLDNTAQLIPHLDHLIVVQEAKLYVGPLQANQVVLQVHVLLFEHIRLGYFALVLPGQVRNDVTLSAILCGQVEVGLERHCCLELLVVFANEIELDGGHEPLGVVQELGGLKVEQPTDPFC